MIEINTHNIIINFFKNYILKYFKNTFNKKIYAGGDPNLGPATATHSSGYSHPNRPVVEERSLSPK